jgi:hypothetical protein
MPRLLSQVSGERILTRSMPIFVDLGAILGDEFAGLDDGLGD